MVNHEQSNVMRPRETINAVSISDWDEIRRKFEEKLGSEAGYGRNTE